MPPPNTPEEGTWGEPPGTSQSNAVLHGSAVLSVATPTPIAAFTTTTPSPASKPNNPGRCSTPTDLHALDYESPVDENLLCPICRAALVSPIITAPCDHVFCQRCLLKAHAINPVCPVDRRPLHLTTETRPAPRIVQAQLDSLSARCPNAARGCRSVVVRALMQDHIEKYCGWTTVSCSGVRIREDEENGLDEENEENEETRKEKETEGKCNRMVLRQDFNKGCVHYEVHCEDCGISVERAHLYAHMEQECEEREGTCRLCKIEITMCHLQAHKLICPKVSISCRHAALGCLWKGLRESEGFHAEECGYRVVALISEKVAEMRDRLSEVEETNRMQNRRIKFLESSRGFELPSSTTSSAASASMRVEAQLRSDGAADSASYVFPLSSSSSSTTATATATATATDDPSAAAANLPALDPVPAPYESRDQYFLSLFETMEAKVDRVSSALTEVEGRHSLMLFNETLQIKDQLTEIRSTLGVMGMHVRWLMNFRLQERGRVGVMVGTGVGVGMAGGDGGGGGGGSVAAMHQQNPHPPAHPPPGPPGGGGGFHSGYVVNLGSGHRRLSDGLRENPARL